ncbi:type IV secretion system protein [Roseinatronobacter alkalisoli]|uniref:Type IV secretion system protein n=1 Tax=Roseinatronobacter alkalisoli TaxID=3028235 RepID=A0ABT5TBE3_9RHOB|nr:type IV secretion system protein [Roseinatronobacter sp. HJB301]MDD7972005.1 type IV secretion system protein [Roseinatronobacter sp. HJB301]
MWSKFRISVCALSLAAMPLVAPNPALAQGVPTFDAQNLTNQIRQLQHMLDDMGIQTDQLDTLIEQVTLLDDQLSQLQDIHGILTSSNPMSQLLGGDLDCVLGQDFSGLMNVVHGISSGSIVSTLTGGCGDIGASVERVLTSAGLGPQIVQQLSGSINAGDRRLGQQASAAAMTSAAAESSYERSNTSVRRIEIMVGEIGNLADVKASVDHNTLVTAEIGIILLQMLELQAAQTMADGVAGVSTASQQAEEKAFSDLTMPPLRVQP